MAVKRIEAEPSGLVVELDHAALISLEFCGGDLSTSTAVEVRRLSHPDVLVEVEIPAVAKA